MDRSRLSRAIKGVIAATAVSTSFVTLSFAQEVEEIVVTGSRIQRATDANSATPISVFDAAQLADSGQTTLEDFLQEIPSMTGGQIGSSVNNGSAGLATVSLRGLGSSRTLILLNGRRLPSAGPATGTVDLNMIPMAAVERMEVLRDGASTIYGSDAIAGVINIITKQNFEGAEVYASAGTSQENDGQEYSAAWTFGASTEDDDGHIVFSVQYTRRHDIFQGDRKWSDCPLFESGDQVLCGGSSTTSPAQYFSALDPATFAGGRIVDPTSGNAVPFSPEVFGFNYAEVSYLITPQEVVSSYGFGEKELWDWKDFTTFGAFGEFLFTNRQSDQLLAAEGTFFQPTVPASNPGNPQGEDVIILRRLTETGGRSFNQDVNTWHGVVGFKGEFCNEWTWDLFYNYNRWVDTQIDRGRANPDRFQTLLDPAACNADGDCPGVWNPFRENTLTQAMQDYALVVNSPVEKSKLSSLQANLVGDFGDFALTSEPFQWALGYEQRRESTQITADGAASLGQIYFVSGVDWGGSYDVDEVYGELRAPLMEGRPGVDLLAFEASFRYSDYDTIGDDTTFGAVIEYAPFEQLRFRGTYSEGFRAPGLDDLFLPPTQSAETYTDPCNEYGTKNGNPTLQANCAADGLSPTVTFSSPQATGLFGGNEDLKAEESESWTLGAVWTPTFVEDLSFTLDYFDITINDAIGTFTTNTIVSECYNSPNFSSPSCALITGPQAVGLPPSGNSRRDRSGTIAGQLLNAQNISTFETNGVDLGANYSVDLGPGVFTVDFKATYLHEWNYQASEFEPEIDLAGHFGSDPVTTRIAAFPEWKMWTDFGYEYDCWDTHVTVRMEGEVDDIDPGENDLATHVDAKWYTDFNFNYRRWEDITLTGGIRNLFNQQPPYVTNYDDMNTLPLNYDTVGRFYYGSVTFKF